jgi:hypothetical protein
MEGHRQPGRADGWKEVLIQSLMPHLVAGSERSVPIDELDVVDQDVDAAEVLDGRVDDGIRTPALRADVRSTACSRAGCDAVSATQVHSRVEAGARSRAQHDVASSAASARAGQPEPAARARDDGNLSRKAQVHGLHDSERTGKPSR